MELDTKHFEISLHEKTNAFCHRFIHNTDARRNRSQFTERTITCCS